MTEHESMVQSSALRLMLDIKKFPADLQDRALQAVFSKIQHIKQAGRGLTIEGAGLVKDITPRPEPKPEPEPSPQPQETDDAVHSEEPQQ